MPINALIARNKPELIRALKRPTLDYGNWGITRTIVPKTHFTMVNVYGKISHMNTYVNPTPIDEIAALLSANGSFEKKDDHYLFMMDGSTPIRFDYSDDEGTALLHTIDFTVDDERPIAVRERAARFVDLLIELDGLDLIFKRNPYFQEEVDALWRSCFVDDGIDLPTVSLKDALTSYDGDILIFAEPVHGHDDIYRTLVRTLRTGRYDWLALEMLPALFQPIIDDYFNASEDDDRCLANNAGLRMLRSYLECWDRMFEPPLNAKRPFFKLIQLCKQRGIRVAAINGEPHYTRTWVGHLQVWPFLMGAFNMIWARNIPAAGRGVLVGGKAHFAHHPGLRVQDFLRERFPNRRMGFLDLGWVV